MLIIVSLGSGWEMMRCGQERVGGVRHTFGPFFVTLIILLMLDSNL